MTRLTSYVAGFALVALAFPNVVRADDQDVIDYRQHIMKTLTEQSAAIGEMIQQKIPGDNFAVHLQVLAITAATAEKAFEPKVPGGEAKPDVWANWPDFSKRMKELAANTADLAKVAKDGGMAAAGPKYQDAVGAKCKGCHETYRTPPKK